MLCQMEVIVFHMVVITPLIASHAEENTLLMPSHSVVKKPEISPQSVCAKERMLSHAVERNEVIAFQAVITACLIPSHKSIQTVGIPRSYSRDR